MKVLLLTFSIYPSYQDGIQIMGEELNRTGVEAWTCYDKKSVISNRNTERTKYISVPSKNGICKGLFDIKELFAICKWIKKSKFDCIYLESVHLWDIIIMLLCNSQIYFTAIHDVFTHDGDNHSTSLKLIYRFLCKRSKGVFVRSKDSVESIKTIVKIPNLDVTYLPLCYPFPEYRDTNNKQNKILFFGRINPYKGLDNLYRVAQVMPETKFAIYGKPVPEMEETLNRCVKLPNVEANSAFIAYEEMRQIFTHSDCLILPYKTATQSGVIIDAYRFGKPVVAFNVGAFQEEIQDKETGFLIEAGNIDAFCNAVLSIKNMPLEDYQKMCRSAYNFGYSQYSNKRATEIFLNKIMSISKKKTNKYDITTISNSEAK